jgi:AmmeMemoRadiSam system protein A
MTRQPLDDHLKIELLSIARKALECAGERQPMPVLDLNSLPEPLRKMGTSFVTLNLDDKLRGCIGALEARMSLAEDVSQHAYAAALHDIRFPAVNRDEVGSIKIEVSVLSQPIPLEYETVDQLKNSLRPGIDGVIISAGEKRATYLPQVWERIPSPVDFLSMLCEKAGLHTEFWKTGKLLVKTYRVESFHEK